MAEGVPGSAQARAERAYGSLPAGARILLDMVLFCGLGVKATSDI
jgi:hypothetical protein